MFRPLFRKQFWIDLNSEISEDNVFNGAAALGFYLTLAIFPAFIVVMAVIPYLPIENVDQAIMEMLGQVLPPEAAGLVEESSSRSFPNSGEVCSPSASSPRSGRRRAACTRSCSNSTSPTTSRRSGTS